METDLRFLNTVGIRTGKTTAVAKACKEINATMLCHSHAEAARVAEEYGIRTVYLGQNLAGTKGPYLVDTSAVAFFACQMEREITQAEKRGMKRAAEIVNNIGVNSPHGESCIIAAKLILED